MNYTMQICGRFGELGDRSLRLRLRPSILSIFINSFFLWRLLKMGNLPLASNIYQTVGLKLVGLHVCILLYSFIDLNALNDA